MLIPEEWILEKWKCLLKLFCTLDLLIVIFYCNSICIPRGSNEPVHCLNVYHNELISGTTANRIGVHTAIEANASFSSTKLRSDAFKGLLTSMAVLPLNRLLLLGADSGNVVLLCWSKERTLQSKVFIFTVARIC